MPSPLASLNTLRALGALFLYKALHPVLFMIVMVALYVTTALLALSFSSWWWLLLVILVPITIVLTLLGYVMWFLLQRLLPRKLSPNERNQLNGFTEKLLGIADKARLPYPVLVVLVGRDVVRGKESRFLSSMIGDSKALTKEFGEIRELFEK